MRFRALDIETVPDLSAWTPGETQFRLVAGAGPRVLTADGIKDAHRPLVVPIEQFPPPQAHRVVAIAWADLDVVAEGSPRYRYAGRSTRCLWEHGEGEDEAETSLVGGFADDMKACFEAQPSTTIVTWNGRNFDLPVLSMRALKLGVPWGWYYADRDVRYRYSAEGHLDLMDFLADYGAARSMKLGDCARLVGLPGKLDMTGASIADLHAETLEDPGRTSEIQVSVARYCLQDALQTLIIFLRSRYHTGLIELDEYRRCLLSFEEDEELRKDLPVDWAKVRL